MENNETTTSSSPKKMNPMVLIIGVVVLLAIAVGAFALMGKNGTSEDAVPQEETGEIEQTTPNDSTGTEPQGSSTGDAVQAQQFTVEGANFSLNPNELRVKKGQPVTITFSNTEGFHDFVVDGIAGAKTQRIQAGASETITFTPDTAGSFEFYCSVGTHRQMGMKGTLIVEE